MSYLERVFVEETAELCWSNNPVQTVAAEEQWRKEVIRSTHPATPSFQQRSFAVCFRGLNSVNTKLAEKHVLITLVVIDINEYTSEWAHLRCKNLSKLKSQETIKQ